MATDQLLLLVYSELRRLAARWFPDFLRYMAQMRLNPDGEPETLNPNDWLALRERMREVRRASAGQETPYLRILRRYAGPQENWREMAESERDLGTKKGLESALLHDPTVPLARLMLAKFEKDPLRAAFLRDYDLKHLPADAALWARAGSILAHTKPVKSESTDGQSPTSPNSEVALKQRALSAFNRALELDPKNPHFLSDRGACHAFAGHKENALADLQSALTLAPDDGEIHLAFGRALIALGETQTAAFEFQAAQNAGVAADKTITVLFALTRWVDGNADDARKIYEELMKMARESGALFDDFMAALDFSEKEAALFDGVRTAVFAEFEDRMPKAFRYYYDDKDDMDDMGYLNWTRTGNLWEEKHPSGKDKRFQTAGRDVVEGRPGTVVHWVNKPSLTVFISDKNTDQPQAYYHYGGTEWKLLGPMEDVQ